MSDKERLEGIKHILESQGEVFFGNISSAGIVSQDVADAEPYFLWMVKRIDELEQQNKRYYEILEQDSRQEVIESLYEDNELLKREVKDLKREIEQEYNDHKDLESHLLKLNKHYREAIESISYYLDISEAEKEVQLHNVHIFVHDLLEGEE